MSLLLSLLLLLSSDSIVRHALDSLGIHFSSDNSVELYTHGQDKFDAMFNDIRQAKHYVHLEYFNFRNDSIGRALFHLLGEKAAEGVTVRAMYDSFGNSSNDSPLKNRHLRAIRATGVDVREYDPIKFPWVNHVFNRDHRKIVVIDGEVCYTGGMNVADYYIHGRPEYGEWRDMHMRLTGSVVGEYERIFEAMWEHSFKDSICSPGNRIPEPVAGDSIVIGVVNRLPGKQSKVMRQSYVAAIDAAKHHIQIVNPYPTNVRSVRKALQRALKRGVKVEFMVSAKSDVPITPDVVGVEMTRLARRGADIYYNNKGFHHSKIMMVDSLFCTVGSTNMDGRSFYFDHEVNSFILDVPTTQKLQGIFERDKADCTLYRASDRRKRFNAWHRFIGHAFGIIKKYF